MDCKYLRSLKSALHIHPLVVTLGFSVCVCVELARIQGVNVVICFVIRLQFTFSIHVSLNSRFFSLSMFSSSEHTHNAASHLNVSHLMSFIVSLAVVRCRFVGCWLNFHCFWPCLEKCIDSHNDKTIAFYLKLRRRRRSATPKTEREREKTRGTNTRFKKKQMRFCFFARCVYVWESQKIDLRGEDLCDKNGNAISQSRKIWRQTITNRPTQKKLHRKAINSHWPFFTHWRCTQ